VPAAPASIVAMADEVSATERRATFGEMLERLSNETHLVEPSAGAPSAEEFVAAAQARLAAMPAPSSSSPSAAADPAAEIAVQNHAAVASVRRGVLPAVPAGAVPQPVVVTPVTSVPAVAPSTLPVSPEVIDARAFVSSAAAGLDRDSALDLIFGDVAVTSEPDNSPSPFAAVVEDLARRADRPEPQPVIARVRERLPEPPVLSTETASFDAVMRRLAQQSELSIDRLHRAPAAGDLVPGLLSLGVPEHLLPADALTVPTLALPAAPSVPTALGAIIAVVGTRLAARRVAESLARDLGRREDDVMIASPTGATHVRPSDDLESVRAACRRPWLPSTVVAVGTPVGGRHVDWGRQVLDALEPDLVWGVVDADRKCEDIAAWAHDLGGLDALALERLDATVTPAAPLSLGIPVARLDGEPATPERWADLLTRRLAVAA
jgi:hypothetical protein